MKAFIASRVAGESREQLLSFLHALQDAFSSVDIEPYITELAPAQPDDGKKLLRAFDHITECGMLIIIHRDGPASEGVSAEAGYAYGKVPIWVFAEEGSESKLFSLSEKLVFWSDEADLLEKIRRNV
ncbi:hypothetical protein KDA14_02220 [Candidatus Saccharibacteria bacterium]|nr:hypothetical protein [Candidatus Saccharibacteria bacterium]